MKFRGVEVEPKTIVANSPEELDEKLSKFKDIYDLQFSTHYETHCINSDSVKFCALILIEVK